MPKFKCLVTGACGFIGSHMVELLAEHGHEVIATDVQSTINAQEPIKKECVLTTQKMAQKLIPCDITSQKEVEKLPLDVDYVFHVASVFSYSAPWEVLYKVNVQGTVNLLEAIRKNQGVKRFVLWGAGGVYGEPKPEYTPFTEETPPDPPNNYQRAKWFQEFTTMLYGKKHGIKYTILRPTTVYGIRQFYGGVDFLKTGYKAGMLGLPANMNTHVPFVHVRDVCNMALYLAQKQEAENEIYNSNDDSRMTMIEVMRFIAAIYGKPFMVLPPVPVGAIKDILLFIADIDAYVSQKVLKKGKGLLEKDQLGMMNLDFLYSNEKLKATGYKFLYPDPKEGLIEASKWYKEGRYFDM